MLNFQVSASKKGAFSDMPEAVRALSQSEGHTAVIGNYSYAGKTYERLLVKRESDGKIFDYRMPNSGMEKVAQDTGATLVNGKDGTLYRQVEIPNGKKLQKGKVHSLVLDSDVFINVPVLKHHGGTLVTGCMKNLMGIVWDRGFYHRVDLHQCIADLLTFKKPTLNILDAYAPMVRNGPRGKSADDLVVMRTLLVSTDIVAIDAAGAKLLNHQPSDVRHIAIAAEMKLGTMDLEQVDIRRFKLA